MNLKLNHSVHYTINAASVSLMLVLYYWLILSAPLATYQRRLHQVNQAQRAYRELQKNTKRHIKNQAIIKQQAPLIRLRMTFKTHLSIAIDNLNRSAQQHRVQIQSLRPKNKDILVIVQGGYGNLKRFIDSITLATPYAWLKKMVFAIGKQSGEIKLTLWLGIAHDK